MLRLTLLLCLGMFAALMTLGTDQGQLRPGLALAASEGRLDAVWAEARGDAEPPLAPEAQTVLAAAQPVTTPSVQPAPQAVASAGNAVEVSPLDAVADTVANVADDPVFTLSTLGNELVPGEGGTPLDPAALAASEADLPAPEPASASSAEAEVLPANQGTVWYVNASSVNVRSAPNTEAEVVGKLGSGEAALMVAAVDGQWARIVIQGDGVEGYVALRFLTPEAP
jgi:uncharacterized protein YgiM (DUF1202 family)